MRLQPSYFEEILEGEEERPAVQCCAICKQQINPRERRIVKPYGTYHESCFFQVCDRQRLQLVLAVLLLSIFLPFRLFGAQELAPAMTCAPLDPQHARCEFHHYFKAVDPHWTVSLGPVLLMDGDGLVFHPVIGVEPRVIRASIPYGERSLVFEVSAEWNPKTQRTVFLNSTGNQAVEMANLPP